MINGKVITDGPKNLIALDIDLLLIGKVPRLKLLSNFSAKMLQPNTDAELACLKLKQVVSVIMLSQYETWQNKIIEEVVEKATYNFLIPCRSQGEFELFRDTFIPYRVHSNVPKRLWKGEYSDTFEYQDKGKESWLEVFNAIREEFQF